MIKATREHTKTHNAQLILKTIYDQGEVSRADIARLTHLTRPTVSSIVAELMESQFVVEMGQGPSAGGKRPTLLKVAQDAYQLLCVDVGSHEFRGALVNLRGDIQQRIDQPPHHNQGVEALEQALALMDELAAQATAPLLGIGIGTPGLVDSAAGIVRQAVNLNWSELPLRDLVQARFQKPVHIANDSHMAALAEYTFGPQRNSDNLVVIKMGRGVGAGIVLHGQPFFGDGRGAGEIGHVTAVDNGRSCTCGNVGCLETVAGSAAILQDAQTAVNQPDLTWPELVTAYENGETVTSTSSAQSVTHIINTAGKHMGSAIAALVGVLNVHHIVIHGRIAAFGPPLLAVIQAEMAQRVMPRMAAQTQVSFSTFGSEVVMLGCSAMILNEELGII
ncbi:MAG: ROK family transcriptional regulator [Chloroflexota bacterium]